MNFVVFSGGVGGAKFAEGMARSVGADSLTVIVNTADDLELYGLSISPDVDTVMYTLGGIANAETGWGVTGDSFRNYEMLTDYGVEPWFRLGDKDIATHLIRTNMLRSGATLTEVTRALCARLGIKSRVLPMTDQRVRTVVDTDEGLLTFQEYFVKKRCEPVLRGLIYEGVEEADATADALRAIETADTIIIAPSNPYLSVAPILALGGVRDALLNAAAPIIAISPIIGGEALKGPAAKIMIEMGKEPSAVTVAEKYSEFINGFVLDQQDAELQLDIITMGLGPLVTDTVMHTPDDRARLACEVVRYADQLRPEPMGGCKLDEVPKLSSG